jgi:signal transduction histidine kinase/FixJ family two-component response regulator
MPKLSPSFTILVVDDDPGLGRLIERELHRASYQTAVAESGAEAMAWLAAHHTDLLLLDLKLPDVTAGQFIQQMSNAGHAVPFLIITGQGDERVAVDMMKRGALDYLVKDVNFIELIPTVVRRAQEQLERARRLEAAEKGVRESERRERERAAELEAILDAVPTAIFIAHDPDCIHITGNRAGDELLRNLRGAEASLTASAETRPRHFKAVKDGRELTTDELPAQRAAKGIPVQNFEFNLVFDDGTTREMLAYATPLLDDEGRPRGAINVLVDLSERKQAEAAVLRAIEQEQRRIGHDLHDGLGQELTAIAMLHNVVQKGIEAKGLPESATMIRLADMLKQATRQVRQISHGLQPVAAESGGLMSGLQNLVDQTATLPGRECHFICPHPVEVHAIEVSNHLYRIAQEAMQNALRHGNPKHVTVRLLGQEGRVTVEVQDDGTGLSSLPEKTGGIGLNTMRYRADAIQGFLEISSPHGGGTLVRCSAPSPQPLPKRE